uniref:Uncharacterized protein n=1 Tax=Caenorhabditis tropicalis TaxID=1561998 RepID=A0A1I7TID7_9PELO
MVCINMDIVKFIYIILLIVLSGFFVVLFCSLIREWFFPEPNHFEQFEEEKDSVPPPQKFVPLDVSQLEKIHGLEGYLDNNGNNDTVQLID